MKHLKLFENYTLVTEEKMAPGDGSYKEGDRLVWGNRKNLKTGYDPYEYCVGPDGKWLTRRRPTKDNPKDLPWTDLYRYYKGKGRQYCDIVGKLDERFPEARTDGQKMLDVEFCKYDNGQPLPKEEMGSIPKDWKPKSGVIFVPVEGMGDVTKGSKRTYGGSGNFPWRGLPKSLVGKKDPKSGLNYLLLAPSVDADFEDLLEFVEEGNLDFIRTYTIIIVLWDALKKDDIPAINSDIEDIKKYLGVNTQVKELGPDQSKKVKDIMADKL